MEAFVILLENMAQLQLQYEGEKRKEKPNLRTLANLAIRVKTLKQKIDTYGSRYTLIKVKVLVEDSDGDQINNTMYLTGATTQNADTIHEVVKWKCALQNTVLLKIIDQEVIIPGKLLGYDK